MKKTLLLLFIAIVNSAPAQEPDPYIIVLGTAQDGGYPHTGCKRECCRKAWSNGIKVPVTCLAIVDPVSGEKWLMEATPDFIYQYHMLDSILPGVLSGIILTHAHMGHYSGLLHLGREALDAKGIPVYAMPRMKLFLENNGPWSQLAELGNISIQTIAADEPVRLNSRITVTPITVPHRDEFSETAGFIIQGPSKKVLFIPDIDKWEKWERDIVQVMEEADRAFLDGTFYSESELPGRNMSEIPHPFVPESMKLLESVKSKVCFIHLNHTNPLLDKESGEYLSVAKAGFCIASFLQKTNL